MHTDIIAHQPKDAAHIIGVGLTTLYKLIGAGLIQAKKAGGRTLIPTQSLRFYLESLPDAKIVTGQPLAERNAKRAKGFQRHSRSPKMEDAG